MQITDNTLRDAAINTGDHGDAANSAVSWAAIIAGAFTAAAVMLILLLLGSGLGFAAVSPWANSGISATTFYGYHGHLAYHDAVDRLWSERLFNRPVAHQMGERRYRRNFLP